MPQTTEDSTQEFTRQCNNWKEVKQLFNLKDNRYEEFKYLLYLDLKDPYVINYAKYHLGLESPLFKNRLSYHYKFWEDIGAPVWVVDIIKNGFSIPFTRKPPRMFFPNNKSAIDNKNKAWVTKQILDFEKLGFIERSKEIPYAVLPLQVKEGSSKVSLIHDESPLNLYVENKKFKIETWDTLFEFANEANYGICFDIKKMYYHIKIADEFKTYFGFSYVIENEIVYFNWCYLPYGYKLGPYLAKHIMKPLVCRWKKMKIKNLIFVDDGIAVSKSYDFMKKASVQILVDLISSGFCPGLEKCFWKPIQKLTWNGFLWDLSNKRFSVKIERINDFKTLANEFLKKFPNVTFREMSQITGKLNSMFPVLDGTEQLFTRHMQMFINIRNDHNYKWDKYIKSERPELYICCLKEILFWIINIDDINSRSFMKNAPSILGWSDASNRASGGIFVKMKNETPKQLYCLDTLLGIHNNSEKENIVHVDCVYKAFDKALKSNKDIDNYKISHQDFSREEKFLDSNERELLGAKRLIRSCYKFLENETVTLHLDSENAHKIIEKGSSKPRLHEIAIEIWELCNRFNIRLKTLPIPRTLNESADLVSKSYDNENYQVKTEFFEHVQKTFNIYCNFDRFASHTNTKCLYFNSVVEDIGSNGINCFRYFWGKPFVNWLFPPPRLALKSISHLKECKGEGLLLVPEWKTANYYPVLKSLTCQNANLKIFNGKNVFIRGSDPTSYFDENFESNIMIWHLKF